MTKKDFVALAKAIRDVNENTVPACQFGALVDKLMDHCESRNAQFDRDRFEKACFGEQK